MYSIAMQDMAHTPEDIRNEQAKYSPTPMSADDVGNAPKYPYGLCISLGEDELQKLGITTEDGGIDIPEVGDMIHLFAMAKVTSVSQNERENGKKCVRVELQITHLGLEDESDEGMDDESSEYA